MEHVPLVLRYYITRPHPWRRCADTPEAGTPCQVLLTKPLSLPVVAHRWSETCTQFDHGGWASDACHPKAVSCRRL
jgi:hypothetical protein